MATKPTSKRKTSSSRSTSSKSTSSKTPKKRRKRSVRPVSEPVPARAMQSVVLLFGVVLLLGALFGLRWGVGLVGALIVASAFPPMRPTVDKWLVGKAKGEEADQAAILRIVVGLVVIIAAFIVIK